MEVTGALVGHLGDVSSLWLFEELEVVLFAWGSCPWYVGDLTLVVEEVRVAPMLLVRCPGRDQKGGKSSWRCLLG